MYLLQKGNNLKSWGINGCLYLPPRLNMTAEVNP